jgi:hypothetical protein
MNNVFSSVASQEPIESLQSEVEAGSCYVDSIRPQRVRFCARLPSRRSRHARAARAADGCALRPIARARLSRWADPVRSGPRAVFREGLSACKRSGTITLTSWPTEGFAPLGEVSPSW